MATSIWSEVTYLNCERLQDGSTKYRVSLVIDTEKGTVLFDDTESEYRQFGTKIGFLTNHVAIRWRWELDRVSGILTMNTDDIRDPDNIKFMYSKEYTCTRTEVLF